MKQLSCAVLATVLLISVGGSGVGLADARNTALLLPPEEELALAGQRGAEALWVRADGQLFTAMVLQNSYGLG